MQRFQAFANPRFWGSAAERHPLGANSARNFGGGVILRAVVDYLDLHLFRAGVLLKDTLQRFLQVFCSRIVRWNHYGSDGAVVVEPAVDRLPGSETTGGMHPFDDILQQITIGLACFTKRAKKYTATTNTLRILLCSLQRCNP
jgi:hypothetical protein